MHTPRTVPARRLRALQMTCLLAAFATSSTLLGAGAVSNAVSTAATSGTSVPAGCSEAVAQMSDRERDALTEGAVQLTESCHLLVNEPPLRLPPGLSSVPRPSERRDARGPRQEAVDVPGAAELFSLATRPGSNRTLYLDFDGADLTGTGWDDGRDGADAAPPLDYDGQPGHFNATERHVIFAAWQAVAADFAPFDVNVTTAEPAAEQLNRSEKADQVYGSRVVFADTHPTEGDCRCAGLSYYDAFGMYMPDAWTVNDALVYTGRYVDFLDRMSVGKLLGSVATHELGHQFGLRHDGNSESEYEGGRVVWAPLMGAPGLVLTQFSNGDYAGANNHEDDLAIIGAESHLPPLPDDHGGVSQPTIVSAGRAYGGLIGVEDSADAFLIHSPSSAVQILLDPTDPDTNLDTRLRVLDANGRLVGDVNFLTYDSGGKNSKLMGGNAAYTTTGPGTFTIVVSGGPVVAQFHGQVASAYGSVGNYRLRIEESAPAPSFADESFPTIRANRRYLGKVAIHGGDGPLDEDTTGKVPRGMDVFIRDRQLVLRGKTAQRGRFTFTVTVTDAGTGVATRKFTVRVR